MIKQAGGLYFILSPDHHGTTQLSLILNNHPDVFSLGDNNPLRGVDQICSCGEPISTCPFWTEAAGEAQVEEDDPLTHLLPQAPFVFKNTAMNNALNGLLAIMANEVSQKFWRAIYEQAARFASMQERFLAACYNWIPHRVFVDGERSVLKYMVMASMGLSVKGVVHVVRDPRGYAAALKRERPGMTPEQIGLEWVSGHSRIRKIGRLFSKVPVHTVFYEDMVAKPDETILKLLTFMKLKDEPVLRAADRSGKYHLLGIAPYQAFDGAWIETEKWQDSLHPEDQSRVIKACGALFSEFGYKS